MLKKFTAAVIIFLFSLSSAFAQNIGVHIVQACGNTAPYGQNGQPPGTAKVGNPVWMTVDINGILCTSSSGGGSSSNITQFGSNNVATGTGSSGLGIPRVTVANDSQVKLWDGTNGASVDATSGGLKVDVVAGGGSGGTSSNFAATFPGTGTAQGFNFVTVQPNYSTIGQMQPGALTANGAQYIDVWPTNSNLYSAITAPAKIVGNVGGVLDAATGSALPANAVQQGVNTNNLTTAPHICGRHTFLQVAASGNTQLIALVAAQNIYICDYSLSDQGTAVNAYLESATAASCGGTLTQIDLTWSMAANFGEKGTKAYYSGLNTGSGNALCINSSATAAFGVSVDYDQY